MSARNRTKQVLSWVLMMLMLCASWASGEEAPSEKGSSPLSGEEIETMVQDAKDAYLSDPEVAEAFSSEIRVTQEELPDSYGGMDTYEVHTLTYEGQQMRFLMEIIGEPDDTGRYPLYMTLHGGGESLPEENDSQWTDMFNYYRESVDSGIYVACRGITDTWDLHFQEASYRMYDRLIAHMIYEEYADPNRVYLLGFSAGGDGVYQIAPRMADRFAAVNMSSGHPNGVSLMNLANLPISLQVGIRDFYSETALRSVRAAEFEKVLNSYRDTFGFGYEHRVWIHVPEGHNFNDYSDSQSQVLAAPEKFAEQNWLEPLTEIFRETTGMDDVGTLSYYPMTMNEQFDQRMTEYVSGRLDVTKTNTNAVRFVSQYTRNPAPAQLVWDLSTRAPSREVKSFYWLRAEPSVNQGVIYASFDRESNTYTIIPDDAVNGNFEILISPALADFTRPIGFQTPRGNCVRTFELSGELMAQCMRETGDPEQVYAAKISYDELGEEGV